MIIRASRDIKRGKIKPEKESQTKEAVIILWIMLASHTKLAKAS